MRHTDLSGFLRNRRSRITPADVNVQPGARRRVPGLRREELAETAGLSVDYYTKIEQGKAGVASAQVRAALVSTLRLDQSERRYLDLLIDPPTQAPPLAEPRPELVRMVEQLRPSMAYVLNYRLDIVAANGLAREALFGADESGSHNLAEFVFRDRNGRRVYVDWRRKAEDVSGILRLATAEYPTDTTLMDRVNNLMSIPSFARLWREYIVLDKNHGTRLIRMPSREVTVMDFETLRLPADPGFRLVLYTPRTASVESTTCPPQPKDPS